MAAESRSLSSGAMKSPPVIEPVGKDDTSRVLLGFALLAVLLLLIGQLWLSYRDHVRTAEISTHNIAAIFEARLEATLRRTDADLRGLLSEIPLSALGSEGGERFDQEVNRLLAGYMYNRDEMAGFHVHDASGKMRFSSGEMVPMGNVAEQPYFRQLRDDKTPGLVISDVLMTQDDGGAVLVVARGLRDRQGKFLGIVHGLVDLEYYRRQFVSLNLGGQGLIALRRDTHEMVLRYPDLPGQTNKSLPADHPVVRRMQSGDRNMVLHYEAAPDYVPRILSIVRMRDFPFFFAVGLGRHEVLASWYWQVVVVAASVALLSVLVAVLLVRLRRMQVRQKGMLADLAADIALRKETEAELLVAKQRAENADLSKTRFLAAASHDLRQPIQAISLFLDALQRSDLSKEQETLTGFLSRSVRALGELLYALLDISKLDAGQVKPQLRQIEVEELFQTIDAEFSTLARQKNLRFKLYFPFERQVLCTDPGLLMSVVRNLVDNALKYTERGGVLVGIRKRSGRFVLQVWDTGIGIAQEYGERIFEECFQVGDPVLDRSKGLGLGLTIARRMAKLLGCELVYASRPGKGSVFEVIFPVSDETCVSSGVFVEEARARECCDAGVDVASVCGWRVVVVEDDPMVAKAVEMSLEEIGMMVRVFHSAEAALEGGEWHGADFFVSDFNLPGMNGLELLGEMEARAGGAIKAVLMTGEIFSGRAAIEAASRWPVLFKPVEMARLVAVMQHVRNTAAQQGA